MDSRDRRRETRHAIESVLLPFLGSRDEDQVCFQYLPLNLSRHGVALAIPKWLVARESLKEGDLLNLNVPFIFNKETFHQGRVKWAKWDDDINAQICGLRLEKSMPPHYPVFFSLETSAIVVNLKEFSQLEALFQKVLKDSFLLKKGVLIYFNHLISYFSRVTDYPAKDYPRLKQLFLYDVRNKIEEHQEQLGGLSERFQDMPGGHREIAKHVNLEELRSIMESEIYLEVLKITFDSEVAMRYLESIKELETRLYANYNTIVMIYIQSL